MTALAAALGVAWAVVTAVALDSRLAAPARSRLEALPAPVSGADARTHDGPRARRGAAGASVTRLGRAVRALAGRPADPAADGRAGLATLAAVACLPLSPVLCLVPLAWAAAGPALAARRAARAHEAAIVDQLPDVVDLLRLTTDAGLPVGAALGAIGDRPGGPLGAAVSEAASLLERGGTTADALAGLAAGAGPPVRPLVDALAEHDRYGAPLGPSLARAAVEARARRRRHAEEAARRLPVTLLFPLVLTTLPAFFLLAIVPLLAGSLGSLGP